MKAQRHMKVLQLVKDEKIETQEAMRERLLECGYNVTQATVSRDIKALRLVKVADENGSYYYALGAEKTDDGFSDRFKSILSDLVVKVDCAANIIVVKCYPGTASAAAATVDGMKLPQIVGSIAGDDTILIVARSENSANDLAATIAKMTRR